MADTTTRDALERIIGIRLAMCDEDELRELDAALLKIERRRHANEARARELFR